MSDLDEKVDNLEQNETATVEQTTEPSRFDRDAELARFQPTAEEQRRVLFVSLFYLAVAFLIGVPVWLKTTATYQAPLPFWQIRSLCSKPIEISIPVNVISFSPNLAVLELNEIRSELMQSGDADMQCGFPKDPTNRMKLLCQVDGRLASETESNRLEALFKESSSISTALDEFEVTLLGKPCTETACPTMSAWFAYTVIILPSALKSRLLGDEMGQDFFIQRSTENNLVYLFDQTTDSEKADSPKTMAARVAQVLNTVMLPIEELKYISASTVRSNTVGVTQPKVPLKVSPEVVSSQTMQLPASDAYDITVTLLTHAGPAPRDAPSSHTGDLASELLQYPTQWLDTFVEHAFASWSPYVKLHFYSQRLHAVDIEKLESSRLSKNESYRFYNRDDLSSVVNQLESYLGAPQAASASTQDMAGTRPGLHLILLLAMPQTVSNQTDCTVIPLRFHLPRADRAEGDNELTTTSVAMVPQWGALFSVDAPASCMEPKENETFAAAEHLSRQMIAVIRSLLGFTNSDASKDQMDTTDRWRLDRWFLHRTAESLSTVRTTTTALVDLLARFPNMVINDHVAHQVTLSVTFWAQTLEALRAESHESQWNRTRFGDVFTSAQNALSSMNSAFFDHTLLGRLYFQEDQKFGIYVPLFVPVGIGLLMSTKNALRILFPPKPNP